MTTKPIGLYVHVPFCVRKCAYCDFCSYPESGVSVASREEYISALAEEIRGYKRAERIALDTVFFGGGTPSLLSHAEMRKIFSAIADTFDVLPNAEITLEANPGTLTEEKLRAYKSLGVNRISIGLQSIHENELKNLGRIHSCTEFFESFKMARASGFENISVDLMYGIPEQTLDSFGKTLDAVIALSPEHVSAYGLIIEEGTPFFNCRESLPLPTEDNECDMYELAVAKLRAAGYSHYEISNYAKTGRASRHNLHYWRREEYVGVGVAAHSFFDGKRYSNPASLDAYLSGDRRHVDTETDASFERAMLAFRLAEGLSLSDYEKEFSHSFLDGREDAIERFVALGFIKREGDRLALTDSGMYVSNAILAELL